MPDSLTVETEIIHAAYAEKVKDAFIVFADNLAVGQAEKSCKDRFLRSLMLVKKARDMAIDAMTAEGVEESEPGAAMAKSEAVAGDPLSAQDRAMIDAAVGGTTGVAAPPVHSGPLRLR
jgi:hypothetical protein